MAVVEFGGALQVKQNFTANAELLQAAAKGVKSSYVASNTDPGGPGASSVNLPGMSAFSSIETDYGARSMLLAVRTLAKNLRSVPGRKALVLFSSGFQLTPERQSELTATIDACNKSNVAVYALDVRGVQAPTVGGAYPPSFAEWHACKTGFAAAFRKETPLRLSAAGWCSPLLVSRSVPAVAEPAEERAAVLEAEPVVEPVVAAGVAPAVRVAEQEPVAAAEPGEEPAEPAEGAAEPAEPAERPGAPLVEAAVAVRATAVAFRRTTTTTRTIR